jgi:magnesium chelatase family protein
VHIEVPREQRRVWLSGKPDGESSATVAKRVARARERQLNRAGALNSRVVITSAARTWQVADAALALLQRATDQLTLSARAAHRIMRVARTIADLEATDDIEETHVAEAITLRCLDRDTRRARIA